VDTLWPLALALALVALITVAVRGWLARLRRRARLARAQDGEREAAHMLTACGYTIVERQVDALYPVEVDGETLEMGLRADYLVRKSGAYYVAEVKTGTYAPRIDTAATRRQLLEYEVAFAVDGVLLVDADAGCIHTVVFPTLRR
jgi:hypothetical protein